METTIYFVRHAQRDFSIKEDRISPLSDKGKKDSEAVREYLKDKEIDILYSSPYLRAVETLKPFSLYSGLDINPVEDFRERNIGGWVEDFNAHSTKEWYDFSYKNENGESLYETQKRNISALKAVIQENTGKNIAIGTHGTALSTIINYYNPTFLQRDFKRIVDKTPFIVKMIFEGEKCVQIQEICIV